MTEPEALEALVAAVALWEEARHSASTTRKAMHDAEAGVVAAHERLKKARAK